MEIEVGKDYQYTFLTHYGPHPQGKVRVLFAGVTFVILWNYGLNCEQCCKRKDGVFAVASGDS